jgi:hypothetical protein
MARSVVRPAALAVVIAAGLGAASAPSASAVDLLTCGGSETASFSPAIRDAPQPVATEVRTVYQPCVNALRPLELRSGAASASVPATPRQCTDLLASGAGSRTIAWSTGTTSTFTFTSAANNVGGNVLEVIEQGTITAGEFRGSTAVSVIAIATRQLLACSTTGLSSLSGVATFTIAL